MIILVLPIFELTCAQFPVMLPDESTSWSQTTIRHKKTGCTCYIVEDESATMLAAARTHRFLRSILELNMLKNNLMTSNI